MVGWLVVCLIANLEGKFPWFFQKDYCFSEGLLSTNPGKSHFYGL